MAAGNCHAKFNWGQFPPISVNERSQENPHLSRTVRNCSRVEGSRNPNTRNQLHPFRRLATIHERYRQTDIWIYRGIDPTYKIGLTGKSNTKNVNATYPSLGPIRIYAGWDVLDILLLNEITSFVVNWMRTRYVTLLRHQLRHQSRGRQAATRL